MHNRSFVSVLLSAALLALLAGQAPAQKKIYAVGDSLTDYGTLFAYTGVPGPPYWKGRFSDGPVWVEQLAAVEKAMLIDLAVGGATTTDIFEQQVEPLIRANSGQLPGDALYFLWGGANDLLDLLANPQGNPTLVIGNAMQQTAKSISALLFAGARNIVVVNLPDISKTPRVIALNDPPTTAGAEALAMAYNQALAGTVAQLEAAFRVDILEADVFTLTRNIAANPCWYMFRVVDKPRLQANGTLLGPKNRYLFFDDIHPTFAGHRVIMRTMLTTLGRVIPGDVNGDAVVNWVDLYKIYRIHGRCGPNCAADLNGDGRVNFVDRWLLIKMLAPK